MAIEPTNADAYSRLAWALQQQGPGHGKECEAAFQKALELTDRPITRLHALKGRAGARRVLRREAAARADYESVFTQLEPAGDPSLEGRALDIYRAALASLDEREPRGRLGPLRVAQIDLKNAKFVNERHAADPTFAKIVGEVQAKLEETEALVVPPFLPTIPADVPTQDGTRTADRP